MRNYTTSIYEYVNPQGLKVIKAVTQYAGKYVSATATLCPGDEYDYKLGEAIALKRLDCKIAYKRAKSMKRRADMYEKLIAEYKTLIQKATKEMTKARIAEGDHRVEAASLEADIYQLIHQA